MSGKQLNYSNNIEDIFFYNVDGYCISFRRFESIPKEEVNLISNVSTLLAVIVNSKKCFQVLLYHISATNGGDYERLMNALLFYQEQSGDSVPEELLAIYDKLFNKFK